MLFLGFSIILSSLCVTAQETQSVIDKTSNGISTVYNDVKSTAPKIEKALLTLDSDCKCRIKIFNNSKVSRWVDSKVNRLSM